MKKKFPLAKDSLGPEEIESAIQVLRSGRYTMGEKVHEFESALAQWLGVKHALMVSSGSSANLLVVESLLRRAREPGILKAGDEVLVPALAWPTTVWPLVQLGLVPVYVDIDPVTLALSVESARHAISPRTKGLFLIHVLGLCANMDEILKLCKEHELVLIEDTCESFGAFYKEKAAGSFGFAGTFSHFFSHHLTTMEGGTVITNDSDLIDDFKSIRAHGWIRDRSDQKTWKQEYPEIDPRFFFVTTGYNVRPLEVEAAIGLVQLTKMSDFLLKREDLARKALSLSDRHTPWLRLAGGEFIGNSPDYASRRHSWMTLPFVLKKDAPVNCEEVKNFLEVQGVETRPIIAGNLAKHPANRNITCRISENLENSNEVFKNGFMIGCHPGVDEQEIETLATAFAALGDRYS